MDALTLKVNLDCLRKDSQAIINAKVGEANGRKVVFTLYEGRTAFFVPAEATVIFRAQKPDGTILYNHCVVDDGKVEYTITSQTVAVAGVYACELQIVSDGRIIYSPYVTLNVMDNLYADTEVESSNEFTELENALNKIPPLEVIYSKYTKPDGGIPKSDLAQDVQNSLNKADTALQEHQSLAAYRTAEAQDLIDNTKQDKLIAGENITIAADGKTISAAGVGVLEVTLTTQNGVSTADKTFEQVKAAVEGGAPVLKVHSDGAILWFFLLDKSPTEIDFVGLVDEQIIAYLTVKQDGTWETTVAARVTAEMLSSLNDKIGNTGQLTTTDKSNLVAAVNEVKNTADAKQDKLIAGDNITIAADGKTISATGGGGGGSTVELDTTLSETGKAADAKAVGDALADKQDTISDLEAIRTGAAKGATALQSVPSTYRTAAAQDTIDSGKVDKVTGKGLSSNDYTDAAKAKVDALAPVATSGNYNDLTDKPTIPAPVTEQTVSGWGFTKNTGTYSKPTGGIPKADLANDVQASLNKADTALQEHQSLAAYRTAAAQDVIDSGKQDKITSTNKLAYSLISGTPTIPTVPTNVSAFTNDTGYLTLATLPKYEGVVE